MARAPKPAQVRSIKDVKRVTRKLGLLLSTALLAGCAGYLRPLAIVDGDRVFLFLPGSHLESSGPETMVFTAPTDHPERWRRMAGRTGAARSAAVWKGQLWLLYEDNCTSYRMKRGGLERVAVHSFRPGWHPQALAVGGGALWAVYLDGQRLRLARRTEPESDWEHVAAGLDLESSVAQLRAAASAGELWVLYRKRDAEGQLLPETFSALYSAGRWQEQTHARDIGRGKFAVAPDPAGDGLLVVAARQTGRGPAGGRALTLSRVSRSGWSEPQALEVAPREFGAAILGLALTARPGGDAADGELLLFVGRREGVGVYSCAVTGGAPSSEWQEHPTIGLDIIGMEVLLVLLLFLAAATVGVGLGIATVRRRRIFPLLPGQPRPAGLPARAGAWLADNVLIGLVFYAVLVAMDLPLSAVLRHGVFLLLVVANRVFFCFYAAVFESRLGATPGKLLFRLRVVDLQGHRPTARAAAMRNAFRLLDEGLILPLPGVVMVIVSRRAQRLGDVFAGTLVSSARSVREIAEDRHRKSDRFGLP